MSLFVLIAGAYSDRYLRILLPRLDPSQAAVSRFLHKNASLQCLFYAIMSGLYRDFIAGSLTVAGLLFEVLFVQYLASFDVI